jgi:two-component system KDP operon response regulator KdpE
MNILIIDDDPAVTELLGMVLDSSAERILTANDAVTGIRLARQNSPDVILLDLVMPDMNGWQACMGIRRFSQVPIIILSAMDYPEIIADALDSGADEYLIKPVPSEVLLAHIHKLLRRNQSLSFIPVVNPT